MIFYRYAGNIKAGLFILGILLVIGLIGYNQKLVKELRNDNREIVQLYSSIIADVIQDDSDANLDFVFENIIQKVKFPIIQTDENQNIQMWKNLPKSISHSEKHLERVTFLKVMDKSSKPIPLVYNDQNKGDITFGFLHYGDSSIVQKLQIWQYIEIGAIGLFILLGFSGFSFIRNNEKSHIWIGMARETAHQLGTPVSALMGWKDWLREHPEKLEEVIPEMEADLERLNQISRRFSNMGSKPDFEKLDLSFRIETIVNYLKNRLPSLGKKVSLINDIEPGININANGSLLAWSIENIIRNSIDAIDQEDGRVCVSLKKVNKNIIISIEDNGRGIPKKDWRNIFRPGFSTKKAGWGLGLSLSKRIVHDIHKGKIQVVKSKIKDGTTIQILL